MVPKQLRSFYFHYNKPATQRAGKIQVSIHIDKKCHIVDNVVCDVSTKGHLKKTQARFVMRGKCNDFEIKDNIAFLS